MPGEIADLAEDLFSVQIVVPEPERHDLVVTADFSKQMIILFHNLGFKNDLIESNPSIRMIQFILGACADTLGRQGYCKLFIIDKTFHRI